VKCLVTGATGFIGRALCGQLAARGDAVTPLSKTGSSLADGTSTQALDLTDTDFDVGSLAGVDTVFHLAGIAHQSADAPRYRELNYLATLRLARLAAVAGVRCFVFLSSIKAMGHAPDAGERCEEECVLPTDPYGLSKWQAECALREEFGTGAMAVRILRPALVYGPGVKGNLHSLAKAVKLGLPRPPQEGGRSMVALQDLLESIVLVAAHAAPGVQTWIVSDGQSYSTRDVYDLLRRANGKGRGLAWLPDRGWRLGAALLDRLTHRDPGSTYQKLFGTDLYSNRALLAATDWRPVSRMEDAMTAMVVGSGGGQQ
jgi:nucleoside-diphosphate-sugar epimerase